MKRRLYIILGMALAAVPWGVDRGWAASKAPTNQQLQTGPFRSVGSIPKLRALTHLQREDAARLAAEYRAGLVQAALVKAKNPNSGSPPNQKGGIQ